MSTAADVAVAFVAVFHVCFLVLEMFLWSTPTGLAVFGQTAEEAAATRALAMNMGLYNGFLAAGLGWGLILGAGGEGVKLFFLGCVVVAGIFGAFTASRKIVFVQALPGAVAMALVLLA